MIEIVKARIKSLSAKTAEQEKNALREIIQDIALLGLWRGKFFEKAAFYGGSALRMLHGLQRFSEDLDFTLLAPNPGFRWARYLGYVEKELNAYGFSVTVMAREKAKRSAIDSAFIKANTAIHLLRVESRFRAQRDELLKVKLEVDNDGALGFRTAATQLFWPQAFAVRACDLPSLFSRKLHALFCRAYTKNIKGRDWFDFLWYIGQNIDPNWDYLGNKLRQSGHWPAGVKFSPAPFLTMAAEKVAALDIERAKQDVKHFLPQPGVLDGWSHALFVAAFNRLRQRHAGRDQNT